MGFKAAIATGTSLTLHLAEDPMGGADVDPAAATVQFDVVPPGGGGADYCDDWASCAAACSDTDPICRKACVPAESGCATACADPFGAACEACVDAACGTPVAQHYGDGCTPTGACAEGCGQGDFSCVDACTKPVLQGACDAQCDGASNPDACFAACLYKVCPDINLALDFAYVDPDTDACEVVHHSGDIPAGAAVLDDDVCPETGDLPAHALYATVAAGEMGFRIRVTSDVTDHGEDVPQGVVRPMFDLPEGEYLQVAHAGGAVTYNLATGLSVKLPFTGFISGMYGAMALHGQDGDFALGHGPSGAAFRYYDYDSHDFGLTLIEGGGTPRYLTDAFLPETHGDPYDDRYAVVANNFNRVEWYQMGAVGSYNYTRYRYIDDAWFGGASWGNAFSAQGGFDTAAIVATTGGASDPGELWFGQASEDGGATHTGIKVGDLGFTARYMRCWQVHCGVASFDSDSLTVIHWPDRNAAPTIQGSVTVGDGPVGVDVRPDGAGGAVFLTTGYNDPSYTETPVAADGTPGDPVTTPLTGCPGPGFARYVGKDYSHIAVICDGAMALFRR